MSDAAEDTTVFSEAGVDAPVEDATTEEAPVDFEVAPPEEGIDTPPLERPEWLPEKFSTPEELVDAYNNMGKKIRDVQESKLPEKYDLKLPEGVESLPDEDAAFFREAGLSNDQAQKIMDYFVEQVMPEVQAARADLELEKLSSAWGATKDSPVFTERLAKVHKWASANLPAEIVKEMSRTASGVKQLHQMMDDGFVLASTGSVTNKPSKNELESMVRDPRYTSDPAFREKVEAEFRRVYGG